MERAKAGEATSRESQARPEAATQRPRGQGGGGPQPPLALPGAGERWRGGRQPKNTRRSRGRPGELPPPFGDPAWGPARPPPPLTPLTPGPFLFLTPRPGPAGDSGPIEAQIVGNGPGGDPPTAASAPPCPPLGHRACRRAHKGRSPSG